MSDILIGIQGLFSMGWTFLSQTYIPGTRISFAVFFVGSAVIPIGFQFLSIAFGFSLGDAQGYGSHIVRNPIKAIEVSKKRKGDVR